MGERDKEDVRRPERERRERLAAELRANLKRRKARKKAAEAPQRKLGGAAEEENA